MGAFESNPVGFLVVIVGAMLSPIMLIDFVVSIYERDWTRVACAGVFLTVTAKWIFGDA